MTHAAKIYRFLTGAVRRCVERLVGHFGFVLLPAREIERMEKDADEWYAYIRAGRAGRDRAYFNGLADYASKKAILLRKDYLPNRAEISGSANERSKPL